MDGPKRVSYEVSQKRKQVLYINTYTKSENIGVDNQSYKAEIETYT